MSRRMRINDKIYMRARKGVMEMKSHKFWAWMMAFCCLMLFYTGYKHK